MKTKQISEVDDAYIRMAMSCVAQPFKGCVRERLEGHAPLSLFRVLTVIKTAKTVLDVEQYKQLEADVLSAIKEEETKA